MKVIIFFVACLVIVSAAPKFTGFAQIAKTNFGKTLLETVQLQLKTKAPIETLVNLLNDMFAQLQADQATADSNHVDLQAGFANDEVTYQANIDQAQANLDAANMAIATLTPQIEENTALVQSYNEQISELNNFLVSSAQQRETEHSEFQVKISEHDNAQSAINEAKQIIASLQAPQATFLQTNKNVFAQVQKHFQKAKAATKTRFYKSLFTLLASIASRAKDVDQEVITKLVNLCDQILDNIAASRQAETDAEDQRQAQYDDNVANYNQQISDLSNNVATTQSLIDTQTNEVQLANQALIDNTASFNSNTDLLAATQQAAADEQSSYDTAFNINADEQSTVQQVLDVVEQRLGNLSDQVSNAISGAE